MSAGLMALGLGDTVGAIEIGSLFSVFLFGIVTLQSHMYYQTFKDDKWQLKYLVAGLWLLELAHTVCVAAEVYKTTVTYYGQPQKMFPFPFLGASTALGGCVAFLTHTFFSIRCYRVLPKYWNMIGAGCCVVAAVRLVGSIVLGINASKAMDLVIYREDWGWLITSLLIVGAAIDIVIAVSMMYYLVQQREKVFRHAARLIDRLVQYTVCTGLLTSMGAVAMVIVYYALPHGLIWLAMYTCLAKLYSNSLLAALNSRAGLRTGFSQGSSSMDPQSRQLQSTRRGLHDASQVVIAVEMKSTVHQDEPQYLGKSYGFDHPRKESYKGPEV